ncbi:MAG TPA: hypothetical protein VF395_12885 [Polyangiaceae bacterium]
MLSAARLTAVRPAVAAALVGFVGAFGCTSILGIDGSYTVDPDGGGGKPVPRGDSGGDGGDGGEGGGGAGGDSVESGGTGENGAGGRSGAGATPSTGGATVDSDASTPIDSGGLPVDPGCRPGKYAGSIKGVHSASFTVIGVPLAVSGPLSFQLTGAGGVLQIAPGSGKISATLTGLQLGAPDALEAGMDGSYDCSTHQIAGHLSGKVNGGLTSIEGTLTGDLPAAKDVAQPWQESELNLTGQPTNYKGNGTWNAAYTGP